MDFSIEYEIGIVDYRNIIKVIKETHDYDFSDYALISMKRRFERVIQIHNLKHPDLLVDRLREDKPYFQTFLREIAIETTEMFRDPSFWRYLRDEMLPLMVNDNYKHKIWLPSCVSGEELYTLAIILKEQGWESKFEVVASCITDLLIEKIKSGTFKHFKLETSCDNYDRFQGSTKFNAYYTLKGEQVTRDTSLIKNVQFIKQNINFDNSPQDVKLILCRNQLIYYTQSMHDRVLKVFSDSLMVGGFMVLGVKEQVGLISNKYFKNYNEAESIYKKI